MNDVLFFGKIKTDFFFSVKMINYHNRNHSKNSDSFSLFPKDERFHLTQVARGIFTRCSLYLTYSEIVIAFVVHTSKKSDQDLNVIE